MHKTSCSATGADTAHKRTTAHFNHVWWQHQKRRVTQILRTRGAEADHRAAGHVLAAVVAHALHHRVRHAVAHRKALPAAAVDEQPPARRAVQAGVAHQAGLRRLQHRVAGDISRCGGGWVTPPPA